jgi:hypothetical protein
MQVTIEAFHAYCWIAVGILIGCAIMSLIQMNGPDDPSHP